MTADGVDIRSLRSTVDALRASGELVTTDAIIDPDVQFAAVQKRADGGPPVLFERVKGYEHARFVMNLFAQAGTIDRLFGLDGATDRTRRIAEAIRSPIAPRIVDRETAPVQQVVHTDVRDPVDYVVPIRHTPQEEEATFGSGVTLLSGRFFGGGTHIGYNRQNFRWGDVGTFQIAPGSHMWMASAEHYGRERIPLTVNFGLPPAVTLAAGAGFDYVVLPYGSDEVGIAGGLQGEPVELVPAVSVPDALAVANAEYVIEGWLDPTDRRFETGRAEETAQQGEHPFHPEWAGYMGKAYRAPTFHVTAVTHRPLGDRPMIQPMIVHGAEENNIQTSVRTAALHELGNRIMPGLVADVHIPFAMTDWGGAVFQIDKRSKVDEGYQRNILVAALASSRGMRIAIAVDTDVDIYSTDDIMWALTTRVDPNRDLIVPVPGGAGQAFQPSERASGGRGGGSGTAFEGGLAIDATIPYGTAEQFERPRYAIGDVDLREWFSGDVVDRIDREQRGWIRLLAQSGR
ncbi:MAG: UbiD family decarboxylase [Streptosporangiales bacterium]|nr:UbiD family decarboxylase [Streptosporangiales bacterium]